MANDSKAYQKSASKTKCGDVESAADTKITRKHRAAVGNKRMHIYINENANRIVRSECKKRGVTITDYVVSAALAFRADEVSNKLDETIRKLKNYMKRKGIKYSRRRNSDGKKKRKC